MPDAPGGTTVLRNSNEVITAFLDSVNALCGGQAAELFIPPSLGSNAGANLVSLGPALLTTEELENFTQQSLPRLSPMAHVEDYAVYALESPHATLVPLMSPGQRLAVSETQIERRQGAEGQIRPIPLLVLSSLPTDLQTLLPLLKLGTSLCRAIMRFGALLGDPVTGLAGRASLLQHLEDLNASSEKKAHHSLVLLSPDNFSMINELRGLKTGDALILQTAKAISACVGEHGLVVKYGGVVFGILFIGIDDRRANELIAVLHETLERLEFLDGALRLRFSLGAVGFSTHHKDHKVPSAVELIQRANAALNAAKRAGGAQIKHWRPQHAKSSNQDDQLTGIFTGTMGKDYRNMVLLWDLIGLMAEAENLDIFAEKFVEAIQGAFRTQRLILCFQDETHAEVRPYAGVFIHDNQRLPFLITRDSQIPRPLSDTEHSAITDVLSTARVRLCASTGIELERSSLTEASVVALPLTTQKRTVGTLLLSNLSEPIRLDPTDLHFLEVVSNQIAVAIDRNLLAVEELKRQEATRLQLRDEVNALRQALGQSQLVHASPLMAEILETSKRVATTDATILVTGESGTGKGVLARALHTMSPRADRPLVLVDCSAITATLIESELFGHEKGAFTGADKRYSGRLAEADGGTLFLDEIGELPLEVQSKLLTFVQEKVYKSVGSNEQKSVDVRIICATNRNLGQDVEDGKFRRDLFYRINVFTLELPRLRERPRDIPLLSQHFIQKFNIQYNKGIRGLSPAAADAMLRYPWPGNIRELQNCIMRAVILAQGSQLELDDLALEAGMDLKSVPVEYLATAGSQEPSRRAPFESTLELLLDAFDAGSLPLTPPCGQWLEDALVAAAFDASKQVGRQAAARLGIPPTTIRRKLKGLTQPGSMMRLQFDAWKPVEEQIKLEVQASAELAPDDQLQRYRDRLLKIVYAKFGEKKSVCADLMACSAPTLNRWLEGLSDG